MLNLSIETYNNNATTFGQDLINKMYDISDYLKGKLPPQTTDKVADVLTRYIDSYPAEACLFKLLCDNGVLGTTLPTVFPHIAKLVDTRLMDVVSNFKFEEQKESEEESESDDLESVDSKLG